MIEFIAIVKFHSSILQVLLNDVFKSSYKDAQFNVQMDGSRRCVKLQENFKKFEAIFHAHIDHLFGTPPPHNLRVPFFYPP